MSETLPEPELEPEPTYQNYQQLSRDQLKETQVVEINTAFPREAADSHVYVNEAVENDSNSRIVKIDTLNPANYKHDYFFGDTFGVLPCKKCNRSLETIEASITFGDEDEDDIDQRNDANILNQSESEEEKFNSIITFENKYPPNISDTLTKDQIMEIYCIKDQF